MELPPYDPPPLKPAKTPSPYIHVLENGQMRLIDSRLSVESILCGYFDGMPAAAIQQNFPVATLEQVEAVIAFYLANRPEMDAYLASCEFADDYCETYDRLRPPDAVAQRLRAIVRERERAREHRVSDLLRQQSDAHARATV